MRTPTARRSFSSDTAIFLATDLAKGPSRWVPSRPTARVRTSRHLGQDWRVTLLEHLAVAQVHVDAAGQAGVEAAHGAHDVDSLEGVPRRVLLEDRATGDGVLVGAQRAV